jgi:hypothetical protein
LSKLEEVEAILKAATAAPIEATNEKELDDEHPPTDPPDEDEDTNPPDEDGEDDPSTSSGTDEEEITQSMREIAEKLGTSPRALYESIRVPMQNGEPMTIGELKNAVLNGRNERIAYEDSAAELMYQRRNLELIGEALTQEQAQHANGVIAHQQERELRLLVATLPAWKDEKVAKSEQASIMSLTAKYGLSKPETEALVTDHRLVKLLRDIATRPASPPVHSHGTVSPRKHAANGDAYKRALGAGASKMDKLSAISELIKGN